MRTRFPTRQIKVDLAPEPPGGAARAAAGPSAGGVRAAAAPTPGAQDTGLLRFLAGQDARPVPMSPAEVAALGDAFTDGILLRGATPLTLRDVVAAIAALDGPRALPLRKMFLVAEGAQHVARGHAFELNARLVFTCQRSDAHPADILLSTVAAADDPDALLQLIAWSDRDGAFHFFERKAGAWAWAGNSFHALAAPTRGKGPFDSHVNGSLVMKELRAPWSHWHSQSGSIAREVFGPDAALNTDPLFADLDGGDVLETIVRTGVRRWTRSRVARDLQGGALRDLPTYMRQVLWCTSVNLASSLRGLDDPALDELDLPTGFFFDAEAIEFAASALDVTADVIPSSRLQVDAQAYRAAVAAQRLAVLDGAEPPHRVEGDTPFAFMVPERAFEDQVVLEELVTRGVLSPRLALCLLLVDVANPVFSPDRAALLRLFPGGAPAGSGGAALDGVVVAALRAAAPAAGSPEGRLLALWDDPDLLGTTAARLAGYHAALAARLRTPEGVADLVALAESRREAARRTRALLEFPSTMAQAPAPRRRLAMREDGTVFEKASDAGEGEL